VPELSWQKLSGQKGSPSADTEVRGKKVEDKGVEEVDWYVQSEEVPMDWPVAGSKE